MDVGDRAEKMSEDNADFANSSIKMVADGNPMENSCGAAVWEHSASSQQLGFNEINVHSNINPSNAIGGWQEANLVFEHGPLLPHLSQLPIDSAFIDRAARFSCFNSGNATDLINSFAINQPANAYDQLAPMAPRPHGGFTRREPQEHQTNPPSTSKDFPKMKNARCSNETKRAESGGGCGQDESFLMNTDNEGSLPKGFSPNKRKLCDQDDEPERSRQQSGEDADEKHTHNSPPSSVKSTGKNSKQSSPVSDSQREEYIHVRARKGQATNSHSLAERVRREKISERMKFLQDLVPGCSKVTGKAVMLDEIINYVQSLQRQVEFLSMKLATVDPRLNFNTDSLLAKDKMFAKRASPLSSMGFSPNLPMAYTSMHPSQPTVVQQSLPIVGNSSDALRCLNSHMTSINEGYKELVHQMPGVWDNELHSVVQMGFSPSASLDNQETNSSLPDVHMKAEP